MWQEGDEFGPRDMVLTREQLVRYAGASGDFNPIHYDDERARGFGLPGVIAHGMLNMGLMARVLKEEAPAGACLERFGVRFRSMVRPGEPITIGGRVTAIESSDGKTRAHLQVTLGVRDGSPAVSGEAVLSWPAS